MAVAHEQTTRRSMPKMSGKLASGRKEGLPDAVRNFIEQVYCFQRIDQMILRSTGGNSEALLAVADQILADIHKRDCDLAKRLFAKFGHGQVGFVRGALEALLCDRRTATTRSNSSAALAFSSGGEKQLLAVS